MAYRLEKKDIVISGWEQGIADDPYSGIADIRNANISSVPKEVSVNFSTVLNSFVSLSSVTISSVNTGTEILTITSSPTLVSGMAITISGTNLPNPLATSTIYWVTKLSNTTMQLSSSFSNYIAGTPIDLTTSGTPGDWTFTTINMATPKHMTTNNIGGYFLVDSSGRAWYTQSQSTNWIYMGNRVPGSTYTAGNGIIYYQASDGTGYIFIIHNVSIDFSPSATGSVSWSYQWNPATGTTGAYSATPSSVLKSGNSGYPHEAIVTPANQAVFVDLNWVDRFYQTDPTVPFVPTSLATYTWDQTQLLPTTDIAQCLVFLGQNILVGGRLNVIYPWDGFSTKFLNPIFLVENYVQKMVTVNTNTYIFAGNRGRIYVTNGTNANLFKKIPDHISGTLEPYFIWGGATFVRNRLYFGFYVVSNTTTPTTLTNLYKGIWSIDTDTEALVGTNQLSGGPNAYVTAIIGINGSSNVPPISNASGGGFYAGWSDSLLTPTISGVDTTSENPYSSAETYIIADIIPVGTYLKPATLSQIEWKTAVPLGGNGTAETIALYYTTNMKRSVTTNDNFVFIGATTTTGSSAVGSNTGTTVGGANVSDWYKVNFEKTQWIQLKAVMSSNATTPTYNRLTEIRIREYNP